MQESITKSKVIFMSKVFLLFFVQILVMYLSHNYSSYYSDELNKNKLIVFTLFVSVSVGLYIVRYRYPNPQLKMMLLLTLPIFFGIMLSNIQHLDEVLVEVMFIFAILCSVGYASSMYKIDLYKFGSILSSILLMLIVYRIFNTSSTYIHIIGLLFSLLIIVDTYNFLNKKYEGNFMNASMDYFIDVFELIHWME